MASLFSNVTSDGVLNALERANELYGQYDLANKVLEPTRLRTFTAAVNTFTPTVVKDTLSDWNEQIAQARQDHREARLALENG